MKARTRACRNVLWRVICLAGLSAEVFAGHAWWRPPAAATLLLGVATTVVELRDHVNGRRSGARPGVR